ncbi:MAG: hypothetical protein JWN98_2755 [Abditibacteriota bacterium]|nr:hypothetical protein [Abditibacteriota bacterium]
MKLICEICENTDVLSFNETFKGIDIVGCRQCGLVWNRNMMDEREQLEFYQKQNRAHGGVNRTYLLSMLARASCVVEFLGDDLRAGQKHLDVGCAEGTLLALTRTQGLDVQGLEVDVNHSRFARDVRKLPVLPMTLDNAPLEARSFDLLSFVHVVEHLFHPVQVLSTARDLLRDNGLMYIEVPNMNQPLPGVRHFFRPIHNFYFTANTLRALVSRAGFTPLRVGFSGRDGSVQLLAKKSETAASVSDVAVWRDDVRHYRAKAQRERNRPYLLFKLLFTHLLAQEWEKRKALRRYGQLLPELHTTTD